MIFVVTNFGRNTKYHPDPAHPALIYYGDMDGSGKNQIIEAEYEGDKIVPIRGRSCSSTLRVLSVTVLPVCSVVLRSISRVC